MEQHVEFPKYIGVKKQLIKMFRILPKHRDKKTIYIFMYT